MARKSLLFQEICFYGELFHCYWWQRLMILTVLELSLLSTPSFIRPCSRNVHRIVIFFCWSQQQKPIDFLKLNLTLPHGRFNDPLTDFLKRWKNISFLVCFTWNCWACITVCFSYLRLFVTARTSNEAPAVSDMLRNTFHAIDMLFVWISSHQRMLHLPIWISLVNLLTFFFFFYENIGLDAQAVSSA